MLEKTLESPLDCKEIQPVHPKGNQSWYSLEGLILKLKLHYFGRVMRRADSFEKTLMLGKIEGRRRRGWQRMRWLDGWHHRLNGHELEQALGVGDGQGSLVCCSPWGCKESDVTERLKCSLYSLNTSPWSDTWFSSSFPHWLSLCFLDTVFWNRHF